MNPQNDLVAFLTSDQAIPIIAIVGGLVVAVTLSVVTGVRSIAVTRAREQTRREIAAYIAEGSIDAQQAAVLLKTDEESELETAVGGALGIVLRRPEEEARMNDATLLDKLVNEDLIIPFVAIVGGVIVACTAIVFTCTKAIILNRSREQTKRELAAYIAEGSLDPDKAIAMLSAGEEESES